MSNDFQPITTLPTPNMNDHHETMSSFLDKIHQAKVNEQEWIETTPEMIAYLNKSGLNGAFHFIYNGIKVAPTGKSQEIQEYLDRDLNAEKHGAKEGRVDGR